MATSVKIHDVYWGSHGCKRVKGHAKPCRCLCGDWYEGTDVYGNDAATAVARPVHTCTFVVRRPKETHW